MKFKFIFLILLNTFWLNSQEDKTQLKLLKSISQYRSKILIANEKKINELNETLLKWKNLEPNKGKLNNFIFQIQYAKEIEKYSTEAILRKAPIHFPNSILAKNITEKQVNSIVENSQLTDLIINEVLENKYPFQITRNQNLFSEINFYSIKENEIIAEIGAGKGTFSIILYLLNQANKIYVNEIDDKLLKYINVKLLKGDIVKNKSEIVLINGNKKESNLPEKVDKVIIRNSYHHFSKKDKMMNSIKSDLKLKGRLYIYETLNNKNTKDECKHRLNEKEIKSSIKKYGFILKRELKIKNSILLEYSK